MRRHLFTALLTVAGAVSAFAEQRLILVPIDRAAPHVVSASEYEPYTILRHAQKQFSFYEATYIPSLEIVFDSGACRPLSKMRIAPAGATTYWSQTRAEDVRFAISSDKTDWTDVYLTSTNSPKGYSSLTAYDVDLTGFPGRYRYVRLAVGSRMGSCGQLDLFTSDPVVVALAPVRTWSNSSAVGAAEDPAGALVYGTVSADAGTAGTVRAFAARTDCGEDYDAWCANAAATSEAAFAVAAEATSASYSLRIAGLKRGAYWVRTFAVVGGAAYSCEISRPLAVRNEPWTRVKAYANVTASEASGGVPGNWVNGTVESGRAAEVVGKTDKWIIFDLADIASANRYVSAVRLWRYSSCADRVVPAHVTYGYATGEQSWDVTENLLDTDTRRLDSVSGESANIEWTSAASPDACAWEFEYYQDGATIFELPIFPDRIATMLRRGASTGAWPRYVKVSGIMAYDLLEIELRTSKIPVPSMVIVR